VIQSVGLWQSLLNVCQTLLSSAALFRSVCECYFISSRLPSVSVFFPLSFPFASFPLIHHAAFHCALALGPTICVYVCVLCPVSSCLLEPCVKMNHFFYENVIQCSWENRTFFFITSVVVVMEFTVEDKHNCKWLWLCKKYGGILLLMMFYDSGQCHVDELKKDADFWKLWQ